jgi:hypothetical protein
MTPILLLGEFSTEHDIRANSTFCSPGGAELLRMLAEAGVLSLSAFDRDYLHRYYATNDPTLLDAIWSLHPEIARTNVFLQHPPKSDPDWFCGPKPSALPSYPVLLKSRYVRAEFEHELDRLANVCLSHNPNIVVCLGNIALWSMAGKTGIAKVRGTTLLSTHTAVDFKLLPTYHPTAVIRDWSLRPTVIADLMKAHRESAFPEIRRPAREIWIEPTLADIIAFREQFIRPGCLLSTDIETSGQRITCIGFAPRADLSIVIPFDDARAKSGSYWSTREDERKCWRIVREILEDRAIRKLFQNGAYDISFLWRAYGIKTMGAAEDSMLLSHALQPESLKGLGYLGSIYSDEGSWKHMRKKDETVKRDA